MTVSHPPVPAHGATAVGSSPIGDARRARRSTGRGLLTLALSALVTPAPAASQDLAGDVAAGRTLARELCSACHLVGPQARGPVPDGVPSFMNLAAQPDIGDRFTGIMIGPPHPAMPTPPLDRQQWRDLAAYVTSLRDRPGAR